MTATLDINEVVGEVVGFCGTSSGWSQSRNTIGTCFFGNKTRFDIFAEDVDNATIFNFADDLDAATRTTASVFVDIDTAANASSAPEMIDGSPFQIADVSSIVQEIVDRPGWVSGNNLQLFFDENGSDKGGPGFEFGTWCDLRDDPNEAATLNVTFS